jgi:hypothetical protein
VDLEGQAEGQRNFRRLIATKPHKTQVIQGF